MSRVRAVLLAGLALAGLAGGVAAIEDGRPGGNRARAPHGEFAEVQRVRIVNRYFGAIDVSRDGGRTWTRLGRVLRPLAGKLHEIQDREFTAADWAPVGSVAATAVNALHVKVGHGADHAVIFSVLPRELAEQGPTGSYRDAEASLLLDLPAGTGVFGPEASPRIGDTLWREDPRTRALEPWPAGRAPELGDRLVFVSEASPHAPGTLEIENHWGGAVRWLQGDRAEVVARVYRPLGGSGRFGGTVYQEPGRVRANHPGVLCVSSSPRGELGGFQIVPCFHANDPALRYVQSTTAYLVIGPANLDDPALEGRAPFFRRTFRPGDRVEARVGGVWGEPPVISGKKALGFAAVEAWRIHSAPIAGPGR